MKRVKQVNPRYETEVGDRVELRSKLDDRYTRLAAGDRGTVRHIDDMGTIHVDWDSGSKLGLIPGHDHWDVLEAE